MITEIEISFQIFNLPLLKSYQPVLSDFIYIYTIHLATRLPMNLNNDFNNGVLNDQETFLFLSRRKHSLSVNI